MAKISDRLTKKQILDLLNILFKDINSLELKIENIEIITSLNLVTLYSKMYAELCSEEIIQNLKKHTTELFEDTGTDFNNSLKIIAGTVESGLTDLLKNKKINYSTSVQLIKEVGNALNQTRITHLEKVKSLEGLSKPEIDDSWTILTKDPSETASSGASSDNGTDNKEGTDTLGNTKDFEDTSSCVVC